MLRTFENRRGDPMLYKADDGNAELEIEADSHETGLDKGGENEDAKD